MAYYALELLGALAGLYYLVTTLSLRYRFSKAARQHGCKPAPRYPHWDPFFGLDLFIRLRKAHAAGQVSQTRAKIHEEYGKTFEIKSIRGMQIETTHPENAQAICTSMFDEWAVTPLRGAVGAPFIESGIFTQDGSIWKRSRALVRPTFNKSEIADLEAFEIHVGRFLKLIPKDLSTFDAQALSKRLVCLPSASPEPKLLTGLNSSWTHPQSSYSGSPSSLFSRRHRSILLSL